MTDYYYVFPREDEPSEPPTGVAHSAPEMLDISLSNEQFPPPGSPTPKLVLRDGGFSDWLSNDLGRALCSQRLRLILDNTCHPTDSLRWAPAIVEEEKGGASQTYYFLSPLHLDVLDRARTMFVEGTDHVIKAVISKALIGEHRVFALPRYVGSLVVAGSVRTRLIKEQVTGMNLERVPSS